MNINTLNILADAVSDIGSWQWWDTVRAGLDVKHSLVISSS